MNPDQHPLKVGDTFKSYADLIHYMTRVTDITGELYTSLRSNKLYPSYFKKTNLCDLEISDIINKLRYRRIDYKCKYGPGTKTSDQEKQKNAIPGNVVTNIWFLL